MGLSVVPVRCLLLRLWFLSICGFRERLGDLYICRLISIAGVQRVTAGNPVLMPSEESSTLTGVDPAVFACDIQKGLEGYHCLS